MLKKARVNAPIVIFPEGTKTNGLGILNIEEDIITIIAQAAVSEGMKVHAIRFDHLFEYFCPYNTTNTSGLKNFFSTLSQFTSRYVVQYYFNLESQLKKITSTEE